MEMHTRFRGQEAAHRKYDLLVAVLAAACEAYEGRTNGRHMGLVRLLLLIFSRYNWGKGQVSIAHTHLSRLWSLDERNVKRQLRTLIDDGLLHVIEPGKRGRATTYGVDIEALLSRTRGTWPNVGKDLAERMDNLIDGAHAKDATGAVVPFPSARAEPPAGIRKSAAIDAELIQHLADPKYLGAAAVSNWYSGINVEGNFCEEIVIEFGSRFAADYAERNHENVIARCIYDNFGSRPRVKFVFRLAQPEEPLKHGSAC